MSNSPQITEYIERARKVLQYEQRRNHQDTFVRGGLELFAVKWADEFSTVCKNAGLDLKPIHRFAEHLEGYRRQDPMQRAASLRAALSILEEMDGTEVDGKEPASQIQRTPASAAQPERSRTGKAASAEAKVKPLTTAGSPDGAKAPTTRGSSTSAKVPPVAHKPAPVASKPEAKASSAQVAVDSPVHLEAGMSAGHAALAMLSADITVVPGVGASVAAKLHSVGIRTVRDLLFYFPRQHRDYSKLEKIANLPFNEVSTTIGLIWEVETRHTGKGRALTIATISDDTGKLRVSWFNQPYLQKQLSAKKGTAHIVVTGMKQRFGNKIEFSVRSYEIPEDGDLLNTGRLVPVYPLTEGLHAKTLRRFTHWAINHCAHMVPEYLPMPIRSAGKLMPLPEAVSQIHYPESEEAQEQARRRLSFDELFLIQLGMQERRMRWQHETPQGNPFKIDLARIFVDVEGLPAISSAKEEAEDEAMPDAPGSTLWSMAATDQSFEATLPFRFTEAQRRVTLEICGDLAKSKPMCRLLQGDVGAGKTAVAAAALLIAALNGYQGAIMAPTELLAEQHARSISVMLEPFGIRTVLLTGGLKSRERAMGRALLENGQAMVAIGTHALIQEDVNFQRLGLVIVDEQHRFGVEQRDALRQKGYHPHMLVMTATPIPRTLALTLYGDLDVSAIDQLPPGRQKIITRWRTGSRRDEANYLIATQVQEGRQAFIICPLIEESESLAAKAATAEYERLSRDVFPNLRLGLLHGGMKPADKDQTMRRFRDHELDILVATSVIEVGIDIPNATVMVIEDADRFGLSQLHQFRGRVGRGKHQSYCYVLSADASMQAQERLTVFESTDDGFRLAEHDLRLRGPGDFVGVRQSGMPELRVADLNDIGLIEEARGLAARLWESDPYLRKPEHRPLRERMHLFWQDFMAH